MADLSPQAILKARFGELAELLGVDLNARRQSGRFYFEVYARGRNSAAAFIDASFPQAWVTSSAGDLETYGLPLDQVQRVLTDCQIDPQWLAFNERVALRIAQKIRDELAFDHLPVLADALEEGGCAHRAILDHCRAGQRHRTTCWVVDLLLGPARKRRREAR